LKKKLKLIKKILRGMHFKDIYITYGKKDGKIMFLLRDKMNFLQKIAFNSVEK
jgi:hypothetical protein